MERHPRLLVYCVGLIVTTLCIVVLCVVLAMIKGMFSAGEVEDKDIFALLGPAFLTIIGSFGTITAALGAYFAGKEAGKNQGAAAPAPPDGDA
jgi:hypothetical protein